MFKNRGDRSNLAFPKDGRGRTCGELEREADSPVGRYEVLKRDRGRNKKSGRSQRYGVNRTRYELDGTEHLFGNTCTISRIFSHLWTPECRFWRQADLAPNSVPLLVVISRLMSLLKPHSLLL